MRKKDEAELAFNIWKNMVRLDSMFWTRYYKEFDDLMLEQEDTETFDDDTENTEDFPF